MLKECENIAGEQLYEIPEGYPYRPHIVDDMEYDQLKKNPALFLRMYENAKKFIQAWERGDPPPIDEGALESQIATSGI